MSANADGCLHLRANVSDRLRKRAEMPRIHLLMFADARGRFLSANVGATRDPQGMTCHVRTHARSAYFRFCKHQSTEKPLNRIYSSPYGRNCGSQINSVSGVGMCALVKFQVCYWSRERTLKRILEPSIVAVIRCVKRS